MSHQSRAEQPERPERGARVGADRSRLRQPGTLLRGDDAGTRLRPGDPVDRAAVQPERTQRDLQARLLRTRRGRAGPEESTDRKPDTKDPPRSHGLELFSPRRGSPPRLLQRRDEPASDTTGTAPTGTNFGVGHPVLATHRRAPAEVDGSG